MTQTVLLVEDNSDDVALTLRAFDKSELDIRIDVVRDGAQALDYLFGSREPGQEGTPVRPDLVLLDLKLPKVDGLEVLKAIRGHDSTRLLPVIILTTSGEQRDRLEGYSLGCNSYIRKPVNFENFVKAVKQLGMYWLVTNEPPPDACR